ncbi:MAG: OmpA family protein [Epsilonproteobacteria bacterium]|nr:OmpA family protein [Campylobacterota bacterium]
MTRLLLLLLLFISFSHAKEQPFSVIIEKPYNDALFDVVEDYDRSISAVGFSKNFQTKSTSQGGSYSNAFDYLESLSKKHGAKIHLLKIDNKAQIELNQALAISDFHEAISILKTPDNGYFIGGYTYDGSLIIERLDSHANRVFTKLFGTKNFDKMHRLLLLRDGGVLAVGSSFTSRDPNDPQFNTGLGLNDIFLTRLSADGEMLWSKKYGSVYDDSGIDAAESLDGTIIVAGSTLHDNSKSMTLMRIDENGNKLWFKNYSDELYQLPLRLIRVRDGNFILSSITKNEMNKEQIRLMKFDLYANILIDSKIETTYASALKDIKEFSDSTLIGVGYVKDTYNTDALAMILSSELDMLTQEHFGGENYDAFNSVVILHNSEAAAAGVNTSDTSQESNMWIVKLRKDATMATYNKVASQKAASLYEELRKLYADEIAANKLAIYEDLSIIFTDPALYFQVGSYQLSDAQKSFLNSFSKKLAPFIAKYKDVIAALEINGHTSSEWANTTFEEQYLKNEKLSMNRSYAVLSKLFLSAQKEYKVLLSEKIKGVGLGFSKKIIKDSNEDKERSRRVTFKITLHHP